MKKILVSLIIIFSLGCLVGCMPSQLRNNCMRQNVTMLAEIKDIGDKIEVDVIEGEYAYGEYWVITSDDTIFYDKDNNKITKNDLLAGDKIMIEYKGQVMMSYPPQIVAVSIKVV